LIYRERDEEKRRKFQHRIKRISPKNLIYLDETGIDEFLYREYGYAVRGEKVVGKISGKKFNRTNIVAGICQGKWIAPLQYDGSMDSRLFEYWFKNCLLKEAKRGSFIVMDNARFHRKEHLEKLAKSKICKLIFLPPYSPDLNPIEHKWHWLKQHLRKILENFSSLSDAVLDTFKVI